MHIVNIMFARGGGGIEQAFVDYCAGLKDLGHRVTAFIQPKAWVEPFLRELGVEIVAIRNFNEWDILASYRLKRAIQKLNPDIAIAHGNRGYGLGKRAIGGKFPLVGVAQNYSTRRLTGTDAAFATTRDLIDHLVTQGLPEDRIFHIPNMIKCRELPFHGSRRQPPVVGTMGRFVAKKGFNVYIEALRLLKEKGVRFQAILGGTGEEERALKKQAYDAGLENILQFTGWVEDKRAFYSQLDVFCLPSLHEPFGIVLLEAFTYGTPVVATNTEGPRDIITPNYDALVVEKEDAQALADAIARVLADPSFAGDLAANAFAKAKMRYAIEVVAKRIEDALIEIKKRWQAEHAPLSKAA